MEEHGPTPPGFVPRTAEDDGDAPTEAPSTSAGGPGRNAPSTSSEHDERHPRVSAEQAVGGDLVLREAEDGAGAGGSGEDVGRDAVFTGNGAPGLAGAGEGRLVSAVDLIYDAPGAECRICLTDDGKADGHNS